MSKKTEYVPPSFTTAGKAKYAAVDREIAPTLTRLCRVIHDEINTEVPVKIGDMPYARQYCLERLIQRLQDAV